jgi:hypothetical protein
MSSGNLLMGIVILPHMKDKVSPRQALAANLRYLLEQKTA